MNTKKSKDTKQLVKSSAFADVFANSYLDSLRKTVLYHLSEISGGNELKTSDYKLLADRVGIDYRSIRSFAIGKDPNIRVLNKLKKYFRFCKLTLIEDFVQLSDALTANNNSILLRTEKTKGVPIRESFEQLQYALEQVEKHWRIVQKKYLDPVFNGPSDKLSFLLEFENNMEDLYKDLLEKRVFISYGGVPTFLTPEFDEMLEMGLEKYENGVVYMADLNVGFFLIHTEKQKEWILEPNWWTDLIIGPRF